MRTALFFLLALACLVMQPTFCIAQENPEQAKGRLYVEANVSNPIISLLNVQETFRQGMRLAPGMYVVKIAAEGYPALTKTVQVTAGKDVRLQAELGAAQSEGDDQKTEEAEKAGDEQRSAGSQRLFVKVTPDDARVRILNIAPKYEQGMQLDPGEYVVEVKKEGLGEVVRTVTLKKGEDLTLTINLDKESGSDASTESAAEASDKKGGKLFVNTTPKDADVRILGIKPKFKQGIKLPPQQYTIEVSRNGYETTELVVDVSSGKETRVSITLVSDTPVPADFPPQTLEDTETAMTPAGEAQERIYVLPIPADSQVRILNIAPKYEPGIEVGAGEYEVEVSADGYETIVRNVEVPKGQHLAVGIDIRPESERNEEQSAALSESNQQNDGNTPVLSDPDKGQLYVETDTDVANVTFLDQDMPFTQGMELSPGSYRIRIDAGQAGTKEAVAVVASGKASHVKVRFTPEPAPPATPEGQEALMQQLQVLLDEAVAAQSSQNLDGALASVEKALQLAPSFAAGLKMRGDILFAKGQYQQALEDYERAVELTPRDPAAYLARGKAYAVLKDTDSACWDFWKACSMQRCEAIAAAQDEGLCK